MTVHAYIDCGEFLLAATGCLTEASQAALLAIATKARGLDPAGRITIDLAGARHIDAAGLELLRSSLDDAGAPPLRRRPVQFLVPECLPARPTDTTFTTAA